MPQPRLQLIHCSNDIQPDVKHRQHGRGFRPLVIQGGASEPRANSWEPVFKLVDLGLSISYLNYLAFLQGSVTVMEAYNWIGPDKTAS